MKQIVVLPLLAFCALVLMAGCSKTQELSAAQIDQVNAAFEALLPADAEDTVDISGPDGDFTVNPISHFFTSYYETPEEMDMGAFVYYLPRESFLSTAEDEAELAMLREAYPNLPIDSLLASVPFGRIPFASVNGYLQTYMNLTVEDMNDMGAAVYLEEYETFYSSASDFGLGIFHCTGGSIKGDVVTLYSKHAVLTLKQDGEHYLIVSHALKT